MRPGFPVADAAGCGARRSHAAERVFRVGELGSGVTSLEYTRKVTLPELAKSVLRKAATS